jgi:hypothetical protein
MVRLQPSGDTAGEAMDPDAYQEFLDQLES